MVVKEFLIEKNPHWKELFQVARWARARREFSDLKIDNIIHNCSVCLKVGPPEKRRKVCWRPPSIDVLKFNVDEGA